MGELGSIGGVLVGRILGGFAELFNKSLESLLNVLGTITWGDIGGDRMLGMFDIIFGGGFLDADDDKLGW